MHFLYDNEPDRHVQQLMVQAAEKYPAFFKAIPFDDKPSAFQCAFMGLEVTIDEVTQAHEDRAKYLIMEQIKLEKQNEELKRLKAKHNKECSKRRKEMRSSRSEKSTKSKFSKSKSTKSSSSSKALKDIKAAKTKKAAKAAKSATSEESPKSVKSPKAVKPLKQEKRSKKLKAEADKAKRKSLKLQSEANKASRAALEALEKKELCDIEASRKREKITRKQEKKDKKLLKKEKKLLKMQANAEQLVKRDSYIIDDHDNVYPPNQYYPVLPQFVPREESEYGMFTKERKTPEFVDINTAKKGLKRSK